MSGVKSFSAPGLRAMASIVVAVAHLSTGVAAQSVKRQPSIGNVTAERLLNADAEPGEWLTGGRDWQQSYYSPLKTINKTNIDRLGYAWSYDININTALAATPIVVDGMMFTSGNFGKVYALDARTGALRWSFEPQNDPAVVTCCAGTNRGVAVWQGKVYVAATDSRLYALDAGTGAVIWDVDTVIDHGRAYSSSGAPYIAGKVVVIGNGGAEFDARGYVSAYDIDTGKLAWRFFLVPGDPKKGFEHPELEMAAKTWDPNSLWEIGLGGTAWDGMAYDPQLNLLYVGTGNGTPWNRKLRSPSGGDNLFLASILAINPDNGRMTWYYQTTPGDSWDWNAAQKMILADLPIDGKVRQVLMQAPKNGFFYVLDRKTGELLSAEPFVYLNWATHVDLKTGKPVETGKADYSLGPKLVFPNEQGGHNWQPMAFNPGTGLVYIPVLEAGFIYANPSEPFRIQRRAGNLGAQQILLSQLREAEANGEAPEGWPSAAMLAAGEPDPTPRTYLKAWDPVRQKSVWQVDTTGDIKSQHWKRRTPGVMTTAAGLVFQGGIDGHLRVYDAENGRLLHNIATGTSLQAAPMTYTVAGQQYVAMMAGVAWNLGGGGGPLYVDSRHTNEGRLIAFRLGGGEVPQRLHSEGGGDDAVPPPVADVASASEIDKGRALFQRSCAACHDTGGRAPDLTRMKASTHEEFLGIVRKGLRVDKGMPNLAAVVSEEEAHDIHAYVIHQAWKRHR